MRGTTVLRQLTTFRNCHSWNGGHCSLEIGHQLLNESCCVRCLWVSIEGDLELIYSIVVATGYIKIDIP